MKFKKLISAALSVVMIFTAFVAVFPVNAFAAHSSSSTASGATVPEGITESDLTYQELLEYLGVAKETENDPNSYINYNFNSAAEMLAYELKLGHLYCVSSSAKQYTLYVNKYTGFVYYVNNLTGQILTSNPTNPGYRSQNGSLIVHSETRADLMSQITVSFFETANPTSSDIYDSFTEAAQRGQISVSPISNGIRVSYVLGDTTARYLLPGIITAESFESNILRPFIEYYESLIVQYCSSYYPDQNLTFFDNEDYKPYDDYGYINQLSGTKNRGVRYYLANTMNLYSDVLSYKSAEYKHLEEVYGDLIYFLGAYNLYNPQAYIDKGENYKTQLEDMYKKYPITKTGVSVYVYAQSDNDATKETYADIIKKYCTDYTFSMMYADEKECGYVDTSTQKPLFRCALEYTLSSDGTLCVSLPASSITFDETVYTLDSITPLMYFGCGDMTNSGYIFYPDGSGTVVNFKDFYDESINLKTAINLSSKIFGSDFAYSNITGAHRQQITMPVYGIVNKVNASNLSAEITGKDTVTNGYFAIVEEGSSVATIGFKSGGATHRFATAFTSYNPYPSDVYDLSETISVGSLGTYTMVSKAKYTASYTTRFVMLTDNSIGDKVYGEGKYYESSYNGMAACYRNKLKNDGVLSALEIVNEDLPLYIEVLGSMDILDKFLTFPITKNIPLTKFEDVIEIYNQLSNCSSYVESEIARYEELLKNEKNDVQRAQYQNQINTFEQLNGKIEDSITNINIRLTGFANGGMYATYPVKVKWQKAVGGKSGLKKLIAATDTDAGESFKIFPEFDFMYINHTAMFDGIRTKGNVSRMVDNRYASRQEYNEIVQMFESAFSLVINPEALPKLYKKFNKQYSKYGLTTISASTLGSALNSNFDEEAPVNREEAMGYVCDVLDAMVNKNNYEVMIDTGNIYAVEYATHILNAATDSSHFRFSSYTIPFTGLVLHSYVNYTGTPINYAGSIQYEILRSIENGAAPYFIVCFRNTSYMKDDMVLNQYYGVDYQNWYAQILTTYTTINSIIGELQSYELVKHSVVIAERSIDSKESAEILKKLTEELLVSVDNQIAAAIDVALDELRAAAAYDTMLKFNLTDADKAALLNQFALELNVDAQYLTDSGFVKEFDKIVAKYESEYSAENAENIHSISFNSFVYETNYSYLTDSFAFDENYVYTDFTCDNGNVVMVTYKKGDDVKQFILNYNNYSVEVRLDKDNICTVDAYGFYPVINKNANEEVGQ